MPGQQEKRFRGIGGRWERRSLERKYLYNIEIHDRWKDEQRCRRDTPHSKNITETAINADTSIKLGKSNAVKANRPGKP